MLSLDLSTFDLANTEQEAVDITRVDLDTDYTGETTTQVAPSVAMIIYPKTSQGDSVSGYGIASIEGKYTAYLLRPNDLIQLGDIFTRSVGNDPQVLYAETTPYHIAGVMWIDLSTAKQ